VIVDSAVYEEGRRTDGPLEQRRPGSFVWIGLYEPTREEFESLTREFDLHPLAVEDAIQAHQRPKLEVYGDMLFLVLKTARYVDPDEVVQLGELLVFCGPDYVITVRHGEAGSLTAARQALEGDPERMRHGPSAALHAILDTVVDDYQPAIDGLQNDVDEVEEELFSSRRVNAAERIYRLQRETLQFRRAVAPLVDPVDKLALGRLEHVSDHVRDYYRDVHDHLVRAREQLDGIRDLLAGSLQANLAQVGVRQNEDMRRISAWVAIIAVPTAIAGIYGMNFDDMPELRWNLGYPAVLLVMATICLVLYRYFKRSGWL
jgi:magnesium transporter